MDVARIPLTNGTFALVDSEDEPLVSQYRWIFASGYPRGYKRGLNGTIALMHRIIMGAPSGTFVDHRNGDVLDNRKQNLRLCTHAQNLSNNRGSNWRKGRLKGVYPSGAKFRVVVKESGKSRHIGIFATESEAARAYDRKAIELYGDFARTNFPREEYATT